MESIRTYEAAMLDEVFIPLPTISSRTAYTIDTVVTLLYMMSGLNLLDILIGIPGGVFQIGINIFLAYNLKQLKSWARTATLFRVGIGVVINFFILGFYNAGSSQLPGLTIVFLLYAIIPVVISVILLNKDIKSVYQSKTEGR